MVFPLPLVPFEDYLLADDRAEHPMDFSFRLSFRGSLDRGAFQTALAAALSRHPLLRAVLRPMPNGRPAWHSADGQEPQVHWQSDGCLEHDPVLSTIDLRTEIGLRVYVSQHDDRAVVSVQFHHVACDGLGAMRFLEDLLVAYHAAMTGSDAAELLRPLDPDSLKRRGRFTRLGGRGLASSARQWLGWIGFTMLGAYEYFAHRTLELPPPRNRNHGEPFGSSSPNGSANASCSHLFTTEETAAWRKAARTAGCTGNDILLRDLYLALGDWVTEHDPSKVADYLRIMIPVSLRRGDDHLMPAANRVSMVFLDRKPAGPSSRSELLGGLCHDMSGVKRYDLGRLLLSGIGLVRRLPGGLKRMLPEDQCLATAVLTNILDPTLRMPLPRRRRQLVVGNLVLERLEGFPPRRPKTHASFGAILYAGQLFIGLSYDPRHLGHASGHSLLDRYVGQIRESMGGGFASGASVQYDGGRLRSAPHAATCPATKCLATGCPK